jgi:hypothetical protein
VLASLGDDAPQRADYALDRMMAHGTRRAAEMREVATMLTALGVAPAMTQGTVERQAQIGALAITPIPSGLAAKLERLKTP